MVCATSKDSDQPGHRLEYSTSVKLLTEHHLEILNMFGRVFLGRLSTKQRIMCLAQGYNAVLPVRQEPATP